MPDSRFIASGIFKKVFAELINLIVLLFLPIFFDLYLVSHSAGSDMGALAISNNLNGLFYKLSEALSVTTTILIAHALGAERKEQVMQIVCVGIGSAIGLGILQVGLVYGLGRWYIEYFQFGSLKIAAILWFLKLQAFAMLLAGVSGVLIGCLRGMKNSVGPMAINIFALAIFLSCNYYLGWLKIRFWVFCLNGTAIAGIVRYFVATIFGCVIFYLVGKKRQVFIDSKSLTNLCHQYRDVPSKFLFTALPIMIEKSCLSLAYIWLYRMLFYANPTLFCSIEIIKNLDRFFVVFALAFGQVTTYFLSQAWGGKNYIGVLKNFNQLQKYNALCVGVSLCLGVIGLPIILTWFSLETEMIKNIYCMFLILIPLTFIDAMQTVTSAACRAVGLLKQVVLVRIMLFAFIFVPLSYFFSHWQMFSPLTNFILSYASFYLTTSFVFLILRKLFLAHVRQKILLTPAIRTNWPSRTPIETNLSGKLKGDRI